MVLLIGCSAAPSATPPIAPSPTAVTQPFDTPIAPIATATTAATEVPTAVVMTATAPKVDPTALPATATPEITARTNTGLNSTATAAPTVTKLPATKPPTPTDVPPTRRPTTAPPTVALLPTRAPEPTDVPRPTQPPAPTQPVVASGGPVIQGMMPDGSPFWGNPNAPVVLHDYSDFL